MPVDNTTLELSSTSGNLMPDQPAALDADGERAAGWLTESLSQPDAPVSAPQGPSPIAKANGNSLGERILNGMQSVGDAYKAKTGEVMNTLNEGDGEAISLAKVLRIQVELTTVSLQADVTTKGIAKVPQEVDQLTRIQ